MTATEKLIIRSQIRQLRNQIAIMRLLSHKPLIMVNILETGQMIDELFERLKDA